MNDKYRVLGWIIAYAIITYVERIACARHAATLALLLAAMEGGTSPSASRKPRRSSPHEMHSGMNDKYRVLGWIIAYAIITYVERTACARHAATLALLLAAMEGGTSPSASRKPRRLIATYSTSFGDVVGLGGPRAASYLFEHVFAYRWNACCPSEAEK